jgi:hypothetical protein
MTRATERLVVARFPEQRVGLPADGWLDVVDVVARVGTHDPLLDTLAVRRARPCEAVTTTRVLL